MVKSRQAAASQLRRALPAIFCIIIQWLATPLIADLRTDFADPPMHFRPRPLWFWNNTPVDIDTLLIQMDNSATSSLYGGFGILPFGKSFGPQYLSDEYFEVYGRVLDHARRLGMTMSLYDEYGFPSGPAGAPNSSDVSLFQKQFPDLTIKRLDKHEETVTGPARYEMKLPAGRLMSIVAMNTETKQRVDLTAEASEGRVSWQVPQGTWKVMAFICVKDGYPSCDYLDPQAVEKFVQITHQAYYSRFKEHFGTTIDSTFHDEPTLYRAEGRTWTGAFNEKFKARYGFDPAPWYPALWYDTGPQTQAARNYLFGFRAELYAEGFPRVIQQWCDSHNIQATGHQDQEEVVNPVSVAGDLMKCFKYMAIPGIDKIGGNRPAERFYKVISSAACNWDKTLVMSETYGAMGDLSWQQMYNVLLEQYTKGINMIIPHAVWYDDRHVVFKPELSYRSPIYGSGLAEFNTCIARLNVMMQNDARHVSDIAVLYPIATLQGSHHLDGPLGFYKGGVEIPEADYVDVGEMLIKQAGHDYTFIHPEVLDADCTVDSGELLMNKKVHPGRFKVFILPGHETISWSNLAKLKELYDAGGRIIATGQLPSKSAEFDHDADVTGTIEQMFASRQAAPATGYTVTTNAKGGMAIHLSSLTTEAMRSALDAAVESWDVEFEGPVLSYIHKAAPERNIYMFANITAEPVATTVKLRGRHQPQFFDPHTGEISPAEPTHKTEADTETTILKIQLPPCRSVFAVCETR